MTNTQTIASLASYRMSFGGICSNGHDARRVDVDMAVLIDGLGPDCPVPKAMKRICCRMCGARVAVTVRQVGREWQWPNAWAPIGGSRPRRPAS